MVLLSLQIWEPSELSHRASFWIRVRREMKCISNRFDTSPEKLASHCQQDTYAGTTTRIDGAKLYLAYESAGPKHERAFDQV